VVYRHDGKEVTDEISGRKASDGAMGGDGSPNRQVDQGQSKPAQQPNPHDNPILHLHRQLQPHEGKEFAPHR
jgi:hypothetical protein